MTTPVSGTSLRDFAMLSPDGGAESRLSEDFMKIRARIDRVVQSEIADGEPPRGPIHTAPHTVTFPEETGDCPSDETRWAESGEALLSGSGHWTAPYIAVPRLI